MKNEFIELLDELLKKASWGAVAPTSRYGCEYKNISYGFTRHEGLYWVPKLGAFSMWDVKGENCIYSSFTEDLGSGVIFDANMYIYWGRIKRACDEITTKGKKDAISEHLNNLKNDKL